MIGVFCLSIVKAQEQEAPATTFAFSVTHDQAFGFYPGFFGSISLKENLSLTAYGLLWTSPVLGNPDTGTDLWLETGVGLAFQRGNWTINPSLALMSGKFLSGAETGRIADGIAPSLYTLYVGERFEFEGLGIYYKSVATGSGPNTDYWLAWAFPGVIVHPNISVGAHYEQYFLTRVSDGDPDILYHWLGAYLKFYFGDYSLRLSAGKNFDPLFFGDQFYKINFFIPLP